MRVPLLLVPIMLSTVLAYWSGLHGPLILDDYPQLGSFFNDKELGWSTLYNELVSNSGRLGRPIAMLSFIGNYLLNGGNVFAWKLTNLLIHLLSGFFVYLFLDVLRKTVSIRWGKEYRYLAIVGAAIWMLHPLQVSSVLYLVQRMALLSSLFMLIGLWYYARTRLHQIQHGQGGQKLWLAIAVLTLLAVLSKENGALLPLLILAVEFFVFRFQNFNVAGPRAGLANRLVIGLPLLAGFGFLILNFDQLVLAGYAGREFTLIERLLTEQRVLVMYLQQLFWPAPSSMYFFYENYPVSTSITEPISTLWSLVLILALLIVSWLFRKSRPLFAFGVWFYFLSMALESGIFPLELAFEHRNYLPLLGIVIAALDLLGGLVKQANKRLIVAIAIMVSLAVLTNARAEVWSSKTSFYNHVYQLNPLSPRINSVLAEELTNQGKYTLAISLLEKVDDNGALLQKLYIRCKRGDNLAGLNYAELAGEMHPPVDDYAVTGLIEIANQGLDDVCPISYSGYEYFLGKVLKLNFKSNDDKDKLRLYQAHYLWKQGKESAAFALLEQIAHGANNPIPLFLATEWSLDINKKQQAIGYYKQAVNLANQSFKDYSAYKNDLGKRLNL